MLPDHPNVDLWIVRLDADRTALEACQLLLSADERQRASLFAVPRPRITFLQARAALRALVGRYTGYDPANLTFAYSQHGKPFLPGAELCFNLSHSGALLACAIACGVEVGVDIEEMRVSSNLESLAAHVLSPSELEAWSRLPEAAKEANFFACWTRKEAVLKATGDGIGAGLTGFSVANVEPGAFGMAKVESPSASLSLLSFEPVKGYAGAIALRGKPRPVRYLRADIAQLFQPEALPF
jgi:4'-phosphopantetheinyl transferase